MTPWEHCGNTLYYRRRNEGDWEYVNPFIWSYINVAVDEVNKWKGFARISYNKAARYDFDILKAGVESMFGEGEHPEILSSTNDWGMELIRLKKNKVSAWEIQVTFEEAPLGTRDNVLEGVVALVHGYDNEFLMNLLSTTKDIEQNKKITRVAVEKGSSAHLDVGNVKKFYELENVFVGRTLDLAIEEALGSLGIHEC